MSTTDTTKTEYDETGDIIEEIETIAAGIGSWLTADRPGLHTARQKLLSVYEELRHISHQQSLHRSYDDGYRDGERDAQHAKGADQ